MCTYKNVNTFVYIYMYKYIIHKHTSISYIQRLVPPQTYFLQSLTIACPHSHISVMYGCTWSLVDSVKHPWFVVISYSGRMWTKAINGTRHLESHCLPSIRTWPTWSSRGHMQDICISSILGFMIQQLAHPHVNNTWWFCGHTLDNISFLIFFGNHPDVNITICTWLWLWLMHPRLRTPSSAMPSLPWPWRAVIVRGLAFSRRI